MANMQKYKLGQLGRILDENARDENYHADRIDSELTKNKCSFPLDRPAPKAQKRGLGAVEKISPKTRFLLTNQG